MESNRTSSESDDDRDTRYGKKPRNAYYARKEEIEMLRTQADALTQQLDHLQSDLVPGMLQVQAAMAKNVMLKHGIREMEFALEGAQAMFLNSKVNRLDHPLNTYIHLPLDLMHRRQLMLSIKEQKLADAMRFIQDRIRGLSLDRLHRQSECYDTAKGDRILVQFDVMPFKGASSVKQVYHEALLAMRNFEFALWEQLGITAIRETDDLQEASIAQYRLIATTPDGVDVENNQARFQRFVDGDEVTSYGLLATDAVEKDDLYPYQPDLRVRQDLSAVVLVCACPQKPGTVTVVRYGFARVHQPRCGLSEEKEERLMELLPRWGDVIRAAMREYVLNRLRTPAAS
ncbi:hypothetical protein Poli38472_012363 [Pythium oligandrum]|uniref:Uncharacterized protein n=1 Tax=Pythium oligandrum TaxID=41045 RepID=A0A8K1FPT8_PYTOL|nr:hypothetical protein Poli38472_012363 [Pythium oligandrum]|eukprot:TMW67247.1 hypothetical protein Poli38472_012363 [Pythium oligandrum]